MTGAVTHSCPTREVLRDFNDGRIRDDRVVDEISEHLGTCQKCLARLDSFGPDPLAKGLRIAAVTELGDGEQGASEDDSFNEMLFEATPNTASWNQEPSRRFAEHQYQILASVGEGSFGKVFLGTLDSDKICAVKIPHRTQLVTSLHQEQFLFDCEKADLLKHPNILPLTDHGFWDDRRMFYTSDYVESPTLTEVARNNGNIRFEQAIEIFSQVAQAIQSAHQSGVLHRHLNPDNILLENWDMNEKLVVRVTDFGFTIDSRYQFGLLEPKKTITPFDSPESANNDADFVDLRADVYSLGKILKLLLRISGPQSARTVEVLTEIIDKSTSLRRRKRFDDVDQLLAALKLASVE
jgi:serine/threonine protein kinase